MAHKDIGASLQAAMRDIGLEQAQAARKSRQHYSNVSLLLSGKRRLGSPCGVRLCTVVNRKLAALLGEPVPRGRSYKAAVQTFTRLRAQFALKRAADATENLIAANDE